MLNTLKVEKPNPHHNNWGIMVWSDEDSIQKFLQETWMEFFCNWMDQPEYKTKRQWKAFLQGQTDDWIYYEFWKDQTEEFRCKVYLKAEELANRFNIPLEFFTALTLATIKDPSLLEYTVVRMALQEEGSGHYEEQVQRAKNRLLVDLDKLVAHEAAKYVVSLL